MRHPPKRTPMRRLVGFGLLILAEMLSPAVAQKAEPRLPVVIAGEMPLYPMMARAARVQGIARMKVTTDGRKVISVDAESGPPMLVKFARENILTWKFVEHKARTFVTTFDYVLEEPAQCDYTNDAVTLRLPLEVRIIAKGLKTCDPAAETKPHP